MKPLHPSFFLVPAGLLLAGCHPEAHSPTVDVLGSYFPSWMVCMVAGVVLSLVARQLFIGFKLDAHLRPAPLVYLCLTILFTLAVWRLFFQN